MPDTLSNLRMVLDKARRDTDRAMRAARRLRLDPVASAVRVGTALAAERAAYEALCSELKS